jgi:hypothetical protein
MTITLQAKDLIVTWVLSAHPRSICERAAIGLREKARTMVARETRLRDLRLRPWRHGAVRCEQAN